MDNTERTNKHRFFKNWKDHINTPENMFFTSHIGTNLDDFIRDTVYNKNDKGDYNTFPKYHIDDYEYTGTTKDEQEVIEKIILGLPLGEFIVFEQGLPSPIIKGADTVYVLLKFYSNKIRINYDEMSLVPSILTRDQSFNEMFYTHLPNKILHNFMYHQINITQLSLKNMSGNKSGILKQKTYKNILNDLYGKIAI